MNPPGVEKLAAALGWWFCIIVVVVVVVVYDCYVFLLYFIFLMCVFTFSLCCVFFLVVVFYFSTFVFIAFIVRIYRSDGLSLFSVDCWLCICKLFLLYILYRYFQRRVNLEYNCTLMPGVSWNTNKWFNTRAYNTQQL